MGPKKKTGLKDHTGLVNRLVHPQAIQDLDEFVSSREQETFNITSLAHQWILCIP